MKKIEGRKSIHKEKDESKYKIYLMQKGNIDFKELFSWFEIEKNHLKNMDIGWGQKTWKNKMVMKDDLTYLNHSIIMLISKKMKGRCIYEKRVFIRRRIFKKL